MKDLFEAKQCIATIECRLEQQTLAFGEVIQRMLGLASENKAIREQLEEALGMICLADVRADADVLMVAGAREAQAND